MSTVQFPTALVKWLATLPLEDAIRETAIATLNLRRINNHLNRNNKDRIHHGYH